MPQTAPFVYNFNNTVQDLALGPLSPDVLEVICMSQLHRLMPDFWKTISRLYSDSWFRGSLSNYQGGVLLFGSSRTQEMASNLLIPPSPAPIALRQYSGYGL